MLMREARWLGAQLAAQADAAFPLLNIGSSTAKFRTVRQPWIDRELFAPARAAGRAVTHVDLKHADGVDVVADIEDPAAARALAARGCRGVLCTNLLEHVTDVDRTCAALWALVPPGGTLILSGPYRYPLHLDPIDNGFRPSPAELAARFPGAELVTGDVIVDHSFLRYVTLSVPRFFEEVSRVFTPFWRFGAWTQAMRRWGYVHRRFAASGVVLRRPV